MSKPNGTTRQTVTKKLMVHFTPAERMRRLEDMAACDDELQTTEARHTEIKQSMKGEIAKIAAQKQTIRAEVNANGTYKDVAVEVIIDFQTGVYYEYRADTDQITTSRAATSEELQLTLDEGPKVNGPIEHNVDSAGDAFDDAGEANGDGDGNPYADADPNYQPPSLGLPAPGDVVDAEFVEGDKAEPSEPEPPKPAETDNGVLATKLAWLRGLNDADLDAWLENATLDELRDVYRGLGLGDPGAKRTMTLSRAVRDEIVARREGGAS